MDYDKLLDIATEIGYRLAMCGAETFRIEDSINRILSAYSIDSEAFAIPNYLTVSIKTAEGKSITRMRRIGFHGNDLDGVERYNNLSRKICAEHPEPETALLWLQHADAAKRQYKLPMYLLGNFLGAAGFAVLFGGGFKDCLCSGICGIAVGLVNRFMDSVKANQFFRTIAAAFLMAVPAYLMHALRIADNSDTVIIGALMILVPGLIFTNAMRDIIYGDTNSGLNRIVHVFLIAIAIALGTGAAWHLSGSLWNIPDSPAILSHPLWLECLASLIGCLGFALLFNIHGHGVWLCVLGGMLTWAVYALILHSSDNDLTAYFFATVTASIYAEAMARIRKYPAISYLVVSAFPLIPGAGVYYTMRHAVRGDMESFVAQGMHTVSIAGVMAVGILLATTIIRLCLSFRRRASRR